MPSRPPSSAISDASSPDSARPRAAALPPVNPNLSLSPQPRDPPRASPNRMSHHRQSWSQDLRGVPSSPHRQRHASMSQQALQELFTNPPIGHRGDDRFAGRDWKSISVGEVVDPEEVRFAELDTSVEEATNLLIEGGAPNVVLIRQHRDTRTAISTFDFSDLNAYLLVIVGLARPAEGNAQVINDIARRGREGKTIPVKDIDDMGKKEALVTLPESAPLTRAVETFGSGVHRILLTSEGTTNVTGVLTQLRLVRFFWENGRHFPSIEPLYGSNLQDLSMGSRSVMAINGDKPLTDALELMYKESITSLPVLDNHHNVVGNISHVDVRLLTKSTSLPLLNSSCIHFISVILSERGMDDGKDSYPVFYVSPWSTLAHTVAKLTATRSHRMWIVDQPSPGASAPPTPNLAPSSPATFNAPTHGPPYTASTGNAVPAASLPGQHMSGRLSGVVSLTDVLNLFAKASGLRPQDPDDARRRRRRSSSSSMRVSIDSARSSSADLSRSGSISNSRQDLRR